MAIKLAFVKHFNNFLPQTITVAHEDERHAVDNVIPIPRFAFGWASNTGCSRPKDITPLRKP